ncbi:flagellar hook-length control protein FliK [uncultured Roseibium sp.]|uniref:flagellar hook-length control protein FliK n=1 Tax=uncultured Roseibium sp. TaxID=1936171 RepID=UPI002630BDFC|nr:flagellar hook-length control protein FliK [uncultured Roseibium sp.]
MVETVSASPLPQATGNGTVAQGLEPGTELKAKVEANLPGGVVRLATADAKLELRVPAPLPEGGEVTVTVSGSKQQPAILITVGKEQPQQQPSPPATASQGQASQAQPSQAQAQASQVQASKGQTGQAPAQSEAGAPLQPQPSTATAYPRPSPVLAHLVQVLSVNTAPGQTAGNAQTLPQTPLPGASPPTSAPPAAGGAQPPASGNVATAQPLPPTGASGQTIAGVPPPAGASPQNSAPTQPAAPSQGSAPAPNGPSGGPVQPQVATAPPAGTPSSGFSQPGQPAPPAVAAAGQVPSGGGVPVTAAPGQGAASLSNLTGGQPVSQPAAVASTVTVVPTQPGTSVNPPIANTSAVSPAGASVQAPPSTLSAGTLATPAPPPLQGNPAAPVGAPSGNAPAPATNALGVQSAVPGTAPGQVPAGPGAGAPVSSTVQANLQSGGSSGPTPVQGSQLASTAAGAGANSASPPAANLPGTGVPNQATGQSNGAFQTVGGQPVVLTRTAIPQTYPASIGASVPIAGAPNPTAQAPVVGQQPANKIAELLKQPLSEQQAGLGSLFAQIGSLMSAQSSGNVSLPDPVVKAMQQILGLRLSSAQAPTAQDLQQAVRLSGQFREAQLSLPSGAQPQGQVALPDLKSALLSFKALLQQLGARSEITHPAGQPPAPSRHGAPQGQAQQTSSGFWAGAASQNLQALLKETDSALARLRLTQLSNTKLSRDDGPRAASRPMDLVVELPLAFGNETAVMQMQVGRDGAGNQDEDEGEPAWRLRFALDLTATGPLEAAISLRGGGTYASLWVDRKETFDSLNAVRETMEAAFADAGLDLQELRLIRGLPPRTAAKYGALIDRQS